MADPAVRRTRPRPLRFPTPPLPAISATVRPPGRWRQLLLGLATLAASGCLGPPATVGGPAAATPAVTTPGPEPSAVASPAAPSTAPASPGDVEGDGAHGAAAAAGVRRAPLRGESPDRVARRLTLRVRAGGCGRLATGSGFAFDEHTLITNRHVVDQASQVSLNTWDGQSLAATVVGVSSVEDLAVVRVQAALPQPAPLAPADPVAGDLVTVVGFPSGGKQRLDGGSVVEVVEGSAFGSTGQVLRLTAAVQPGNSGGPVLDAGGRVAGVVYARELTTGYGLAIPASSVRHLLEAGSGALSPVRC